LYDSRSNSQPVSPASVSISIVIPAYNSSQHLKSCLHAILQSDLAPWEIIVVDDGSKDGTKQTAASFGTTVLTTGGRCGPAVARNIGAQAATGEIVLFLDSDVCVKPGTLSRVAHWFDNDAELDALIGSYDSTPEAKDFLSQYRNLMHSYVHQTGEQLASTFWSGCGAIRRSIFLEHSGFDPDYGRPAIEDIELGYRMLRAGCKIVLDRSLEVTHLKSWTFWNLLKTDVLDRGIPWTELILRDRYMPNDLNLQLSQRVSVALVFILVALSGLVAVMSGGYILIPLFAVLFLLLARWWVDIRTSARPKSAYIALIAVVAAIVTFAYFAEMYGLIPPLVVSPVLLVFRHRYRKNGHTRRSLRWIGIFYICFSVFMAAVYLPASWLMFVCFAILALLGVMNSQFYIFLAGKRGVAFMLAAIPFHLLYHFYNGLSFIIGASRHLASSAARRQVRPLVPERSRTDIDITQA